MTHVRIESSFTGKTWEGEVEVEDLEDVFRFFNRVEPGDGLRLELIGYRLPSLSAGDRVTLDGVTWECAPVGWTPVDPDTPMKPWPL